MEKARARLRIHGRVQGVFFRASTRDQARRLQVVGWVRNMVSGDVEALAEGDRAAVERLIQWCHQGPSSARVTRVEVEWEPFKDEFDDFSIAY